VNKEINFLKKYICHHHVSVHPSVTSWCSTKTAKLRIMQATPYNSPVTLVSNAKNLGEIPLGSYPMVLLENRRLNLPHLYLAPYCGDPIGISSRSLAP